FQRRPPPERADRLDVPAGLADEPPDIRVRELDLDRDGAAAALERLHEHFLRLLSQRLGHVLDQRPVVDARAARPVTSVAAVVATTGAASTAVTPGRSTSASLRFAQGLPPAS